MLEKRAHVGRSDGAGLAVAIDLARRRDGTDNGEMGAGHHARKIGVWPTGAEVRTTLGRG